MSLVNISSSRHSVCFYPKSRLFHHYIVPYLSLALSLQYKHYTLACYPVLAWVSRANRLLQFACLLTISMRPIFSESQPGARIGLTELKVTWQLLHLPCHIAYQLRDDGQRQRATHTHRTPDPSSDTRYIAIGISTQPSSQPDRQIDMQSPFTSFHSHVRCTCQTASPLPSKSNTRALTYCVLSLFYICASIRDTSGCYGMHWIIRIQMDQSLFVVGI